ncbi:MAG: cupin domain-containing protein [Chlorobiaceae bacterium]|nr:cupin domain-containing protein [Chlorobiaceae bacterium]
MRNAVLCLSLCIGWSITATAEDYPDIKVEKLLVSTTAYNGQSLAYLSGKKPEVTAMTVTIPPGGVTGWHQHQVPVYAYVLDGELTVDLKGTATYRFRKGDVILEVMHILHNGRNTGDKVTKLLVFYAGTSGMPNVIRQDP